MIGHTLGRYQILEQLGEGGMATVYKAYDTRLGRYVALKVMHPTANLQPALLRRFENEARSLAQLSHPAIVRVLDYGEQDGWPYLVLEYIPSGTLKDMMLHGPIAWRDAARFLAPIARALEYAHQHGIIHRDVKPSNILMTESGQPMLSDFGIAKTLEGDTSTDITTTGLRLGTPEYMSPEQCTGSPVDARTDIYSLGIVLYEMLTGRKPFTADSSMAVMHQQVYDTPPAPHLFVPNLPWQVEQVVDRAMAKTPEARYQTMGEFATALESLDGEKAASRPAIRPSRTGGVRFPMRLLLGVLGAVIALLVLGSLAALARPLINTWLAGVAGGSTPPAQSTPGGGTATVSNAWKQGKLAVTQRQGTANGLFVYNMKAETFRLIYAAEGKNALGADWAADGKRIAYYIYPNDMRVIDTSTDKPSVGIGNCGSPSWSPDSRRIVCVSPGGQLVMYDLKGNADAVENSTGSTPAWSPARGEIAYTTLTANKQGSMIWRTSLSSHEPVTLVDTGGENFAPAWSPDGRQIAYQSNEGSDNSEIWVMGRGGENPHRITHSPPNSWSRGPTWSPDGLWLAYVSNQAGSIGTDYGEIFVVSLKTGQVTQVTKTGGKIYDWRLSWSK